MDNNQPARVITEEEEEHQHDVGEAGRSRVVPPHPHPQQQQQLHTPHSEQWRETMNEDGNRMIIERGGVRLLWQVKNGRLIRSDGELCLCG